MFKVAYFGSDAFSVICLQRLLLQAPASLFSHLDVITRSPKPSGRGLRQLRDVQLATFAENSKLPLLRADSNSDFTKLSSNNYDLAIAVSYGKLIPSNFLSSLKITGLNVHPSILPHLSGPAPLQRALLNHDTSTGVTVQTLHPSEFDKGDILAQQIHNISTNETFSSLSSTLALSGGDLLYKTITNIKSNNNNLPPSLKPTREFSYAAKLKPHERQIIWSNATKFNITRQFNTLGPLYTFIHTASKKGKPASSRRIVLSQLSSIDLESQPINSSTPNGYFYLDESTETLIIKVSDGYISTPTIKIEGLGTETPKKFINSLNKKFGHSSNIFHHQQIATS